MYCIGQIDPICYLGLQGRVQNKKYPKLWKKYIMFLTPPRILMTFLNLGKKLISGCGAYRLWQFCPSQDLCPQNCLGPVVLQAPHIEMLTDNRKVSIELPGSAGPWVLVNPVGKVSQKLPRLVSFVRMKGRQRNCLGGAVLPTQKF